MIGDLGGVLELILVLFGIFMAPIGNYSYIMKAAQKLFYGRSSGKPVFDSELDKKTERIINSEVLTRRERHEVSLHWPIVVNIYKFIELYFAKSIGWVITKKLVKKLNCLCFTTRNRKLIRLINKT